MATYVTCRQQSVGQTKKFSKRWSAHWGTWDKL